ncbi:MAG: substrate-binding domain-containing protein [Candidatus Hodarchaeota archaeon]
MDEKDFLRKLKAQKQKNRGVIIFLIMFFAGFAIGTGIQAQSNQGEILFTIAYSSEKESWMEEIKEPFLEWYSEKYPENIKLNIFPVGSRESIFSILNGIYKPAIWSPASSVWIPIINSLWANVSSGGGNITNINNTAIFSPIVIATWKEFNDDPEINITSLQDIHDLSMLPDSRIKMAHTDPTLSNSGFCSIIMAVAAAAKKNSSDLVYEDLLNLTIQDWMEGFESKAVLYGKSTGFLMRTMIDKGQDELNVALMYESLIIDKGDLAQTGKIIAVYPEEGVIHSDHPFCILDGADWMNPTLETISNRFIEYINTNEALIKATERGFRVYDSNITLPAEKFNPDKGVLYDISNVTKMEVPNEWKFVENVEHLWTVSRPVF